MIAPPGFQGLHPHKPIRIYYRNLPHWRQDGATYFVTFHTNDSLPAAALAELRELRVRVAATRADDSKAANELVRKVHRRTCRWLSAKHGRCLFGHLHHRTILHDALLHFHDDRVELGAFVVMSNHVHLVVRPLGSVKLEKWLQSVKTYTTTQVNKRLGETGTLWFEESHDRIVRDVDHLERCVNYIGRNARRARIEKASHSLWLNPEWKDLGAVFR